MLLLQRPSQLVVNWVNGGTRTFMRRILDQFADHGLNNAYIAIQYAADDAATQSHPKA